MRNLRIIARLDIKGPNLIKAIQLEGVRVVGDPRTFARRYYKDGADEILYMDAVASLYGRDTMLAIVQRTAEEVFVPITVGGGMRSIEDARAMLRAGADKIAINTAATLRPELISEIAHAMGSQCMVLQIDAKRTGNGRWEAYRDGGREHTGLDVIDWARRGEKLGAGEILLTSVDREGTCRGFDIELVRAVTDAVSIPVIASGGMGTFAHLRDVAIQGKADAIAVAHVLHYGKVTLSELRKEAEACDLPVRTIQKRREPTAAVNKHVTLVDFGAGNLLSVARAFSRLGSTVTLAKTAEAINAADYLVLPGVGAFATCMNGITSQGLEKSICRHIKTGKPFLGICVGMQLLFETSDEFGSSRGMGVLRGQVRAIPAIGSGGATHKIPHIGWNRLYSVQNNACSWDGGLLASLLPGESVYFVHSFVATADDFSSRLAECDYEGTPLLAAVHQGNVWGVQFHPEKSGPVGLHILSNFLTQSNYGHS